MTINEVKWLIPAKCLAQSGYHASTQKMWKTLRKCEKHSSANRILLSKFKLQTAKHVWQQVSVIWHKNIEKYHMELELELGRLRYMPTAIAKANR